MANQPHLMPNPPKVEALLAYECMFPDQCTGDTKQIAYDPHEVAAIEQCWYQHAVSEDEIIKTECVNVTFKTGTAVTIKATYDEALAAWQTALFGWNAGME